MAPLEGVNGGDLIRPSRSPISMLSRLKYLCFCGAPAEQANAAAAGSAPYQAPRKAGTSGLSGDAAISTNTVESQVGLINNIIHSTRGPATGSEDDVTLACVDGQVLEPKVDAPGLLATLTFGAPPGSVASQRLSPTNLEVDTIATANVVSLYHYCHSSYAINAPSLPSPSTNGQASPQPETYIDLPKVSGSPTTLSPIPLGPPVGRMLRAPNPAAVDAGSVVGDASDAVGDELPMATASPYITAVVARSRALQKPEMSTQIGQVQEAVNATIAIASAASTMTTPSRLAGVLSPSSLSPSASFGGQPPPYSSLPLPGLPGTVRPSLSWTNHDRAAGWRLTDIPSAPLPSLQLRRELAPLQVMEDTALLLQQCSRETAPSAQGLPARQPSAPEVNVPFTRLEPQDGMPAMGSPLNAGAAAAAAGVASGAVTAAATAVATPFLVATAAIGSRAASSTHHATSGMLSYGYGNGGSGCGFLDASCLLADGRSAPYSGQISGTLSPRLASFQYGPGVNTAVISSYAQPPPSPPRSSVGLVVPSRVSVSGAGSVLSLPIETSSLFDVTVPRTGLLPEQTALEMSMQAPALDLWAAAAHVSLTSRIAQGAYGVVHRGLWHGCTCAVKLMLAAGTENLSSQLTEVFFCKALSCHPNIVQTFDCNVWRITADTLQAVRSFCTAAGASPFGCASPFTVAGGGSASASAAPMDSPLLPGAMFLHSMASGWFGASPSVLLSAAPSGGPSPSSHLGPYGLAGVAAASSLASLDRHPGMLLGQGSTTGMALDGASTAAANAQVECQGVLLSATEPVGIAPGMDQGGNLAPQMAAGEMPPPAAATDGDTAGAVGLALPVLGGLQQRVWQEDAGVGTSGIGDVAAQAAIMSSPTPEHLRSQSQASAQSPLELPNAHQLESPPLNCMEVKDCCPTQLTPSSCLQEKPMLADSQLPSRICSTDPVHPVGDRTRDHLCVGVHPILSPLISMPTPQPLTAGSVAPSCNPSGLVTLQPPPLPPRLEEAVAGNAPEGATGDGSCSGCEQPPTPPRHPRPVSPPPQRTVDQFAQRIIQQQQELWLQEPEGQMRQAEGEVTLENRQMQGSMRALSVSGSQLLHEVEVSETYSRRRPATNLAVAFPSSDPMPAEAAVSEATTVNTTLTPFDAIHSSSVPYVPLQPGAAPGKGSQDVIGSGLGSSRGAVVEAVATVSATEAVMLSAVGVAAGETNQDLVHHFPASGLHSNADRVLAPAAAAARLPSGNTSHSFIESHWSSPDGVANRSLSPSPDFSNNPNLPLSNGGRGHGAAITAKAATSILAGHATSRRSPGIPVNAAQVAMSMGMGTSVGLAASMGVGLYSSPVSSGALPAFLQPGSASGTSRQLSDRAMNVSTPGVAPGGGETGGGGLHGMGGPWPLQARSAVATGDESDAAAAMAGARNLAQVLNLLGARDGQLAVVVVMEECDRGSLQQLLSKAAATVAAAALASGGSVPAPNLYTPFSGGGRYPLPAALRALALTAKEVALGMAFLHHNNIIHGDLKPGNVLLKSSRQDQRGFVVKISDFGLSRVLHGGVPHPHLMATGTNDSSSGGGPNAGAASETDGEFMDGALDGTVPYLAPELINNCQRSKASDVWAYGVLLWQLVTGHRPYDGLMQFQIMAAVSSGEQLLSWPSEAHPALVHLGRACLAYNPRDRPSFAQIVRRLQALETELRAEGAK
ncbi:hypothetical protein Vretimale_8020 [Volvox reticuliferus]|uniref:Protein kinase domain-containing protein n=1 Tax=Volvox reticuliferus TaxID=1737510 RepID=A0A8J4C601_9CHLO|nr:hypothetical protein Vretifemale_5098 [Volvox reticuliferus]GIM03226.1 hypothetical protein Vretimale_8020 [Volvox reticuliferus]